MAQDVNVTVAADDTVRIVDERMFGANATLWDENLGTDQTVALLRDAGLRAIRIPGGSLSNEYHWRTNTTLTNTWRWAADMSVFARVIAELEAQAFVSVNYGTGTPEEAAAWVAYANASASLLGTAADVTIGVDAKGFDWKTAGYWSALRAAAPLADDDGMNFLRIARTAPLALKHWEIGNENYGAAWETDEQAVRHDPYTYGVRAKDYMAKMKAVDPAIKVGVVVITGDTSYTNNTNHPATNLRTGVVRNGWTPVLLSTLRSLGVTPDFAVYHRYDQAPGSESDAFLLQSARTWPADALDLRQQLADYLGAEGARVELVVTENNSVYSNPGKQSVSLVDGLFLADSVGNLLQTEFNALVWWAIRNGPPTGGNFSPSLYGWRTYGDYGMISRDETRGYYDTHPTYYAMKLLSHFARGGDAVVSATSNNALLAVYAVRRTDNSLTLLVINKDPANSLTAGFGLSGYMPAATANQYSYGIPQDEAARTGAGSRDVATSTVTVAGQTFTASFAPYSASVIALQELPRPVQVPAYERAELVGANPTSAATYYWELNGRLANSVPSATLTLPTAYPELSGLFTAHETMGSAAVRDPTILGVTTTVKVERNAREFAADIVHQNGNVYDQVLMEGLAASITADPGQIVRLSYIDEDDDIVQVEFSGAGTLSIVHELEPSRTPATKYNQDINYVKGLAGIVIAGADETTHVSVFSVGRATAVNPALFRDGETYDGVADLFYLGILSNDGKFGGVRLGNVEFSGVRGTTGIYAPGVQFTGPVIVRDIKARDLAVPVLMLGSASDVRIAGGNLQQPNASPVKVSGFTRLQFTANIDSHGNAVAAGSNQARLVQNGLDVTARVVSP